MSANENMALVRRYYNEVANAELASAQAAAARLLTQAFTFYANVPDAQVGIEMHQLFLARHHEVSPDQRWRCEEMIAEGDTVVCRFIAEGTHHGLFHGIAPAGRRFSVDGVDFFRIAHVDGQGLWRRPTRKIAEVRRYLDLYRLLEQISGETAPEPIGTVHRTGT